MNIWEIDISRGWRIGLGLTAVLVLLAVGMAILAVLNPITIWTFFMGLTGTIALLSAVQMVYWLWGLVNSQYTMDRNALTIRWGQVSYQIPMTAVQAVLPGAELTGLHMRPGLRWPGYYVGYGEAEEIGPILFYATTPVAEQVIVRTAETAYAISPTDLGNFLLAFRERLQMGPTQEIEESCERPGFLDWQIWNDKLALGTLSGSLALLVLLVGLLTWRYPYLPAEIAMRLDASGQALLVAPAERIFYLALLGIIFLLINGTLGLFLYRRERFAAYFLWGGLLILQTGIWVAVISILTQQ
ncbi:MAG: hypothetical protein JW981_01170 [Anaerolineae bacterium]|nr:hypothetical protein [Anaerolineae bacterium]